MPTYTTLKKKILADSSFLRESDDEVLKTWFWAGVAAVVQVADVQFENKSPKMQQLRERIETEIKITNGALLLAIVDNSKSAKILETEIKALQWVLEQMEEIK